MILVSIPATAAAVKQTAHYCQTHPKAARCSSSTSPSPSPSTSLSPSPSPTTTAPSSSYRAFPSSSYWNTPLPADAPLDPNSGAIISFLKADNTTNYVRLAGTSSTGTWGNPIYWSGTSDPTYAINNSCSQRQPSEFSSMRIPAGARPDPTSDAGMTVYDGDKGLVYALWHASYNATTDTWSACGGTVYYLSSNGLEGSLLQSDQPRNKGHRGAPPPTYAVRYDEVRAGAIRHVLKIAVNTTKCSHTFPMVADECGTTATYAPPEGTRIRIKPWIDLTKLGLSPAALIVARALQTYGAVIGDQSGGPVSLKVENTVAEGLGPKWDGVLSATSLAGVPLDDFQVVQLGYGQ